MPTLAIIAHHVRKNIEASRTLLDLQNCSAWMLRLLADHGPEFNPYYMLLSKACGMAKASITATSRLIKDVKGVHLEALEQETLSQYP